MGEILKRAGLVARRRRRSRTARFSEPFSEVIAPNDVWTADFKGQLALASDPVMYRPSLWIWVMQRFYYGATLPGRAARAKRTIGDALTSSIAAATSARTRDGWRLAAKR